MKIPLLKPAILIAGSVLISACSSTAPRIISTPIQNIDSIPLKVADLTEIQLQGWGGADLIKDTIPGMSVERAYQEIIKKKKGEKIIVAIVDSGVDIDHEDLRSVIWVNRGEIPNNNKDDDNNGFVDDIHGWNFLGDAVEENMEYTRIYKRLKPKYDGKPASAISTADREEFIYYQEAKEEYEKKYNEALQEKNQYEAIKKQLVNAHGAISSQLGKEDYSMEELREMPADNQQLRQYRLMLLQIQENVNENIPEALEELDEAIDYYAGRLETHFNLDLQGRAPVGDDPYDITDTDYGNNRVAGPNPEKKDIKHGTHVAGIIGANRENNRGIKGVANNVELMVIRAVPDGDEYDKDIALGIRYAVDNGAKIINTSFGKYFSPNHQWVEEAIQYASDHDVLIVNAAGNEGVNLDEKKVYPNDQEPQSTEEITSNFLTVGALNYEYGSGLVAGFSNYGNNNVDVFAPGTKIWSTTPNNGYEFLQGTSMAAPAVSGVAALIRSFYPKLSAPKVKQIIMNSGLPSSSKVRVGEENPTTKEFRELSRSGKMVNLYNALILASQTK